MYLYIHTQLSKTPVACHRHSPKLLPPRTLRLHAASSEKQTKRMLKNCKTSAQRH